MILLSIDVGGSGIRYLLTDSNGSVIRQAKISFPRMTRGLNPFYSISSVSSQLSGFGYEEANILIAYPGPSRNSSRPDLLPTMFGLDEAQAHTFCEQLEASIASAFKTVSISRLNDVTAAAYSIKDQGSFHLMVLGTGIGWETFANGRPIYNASPMAGEICNMRLSYLGIVCNEDSDTCRSHSIDTSTVNSAYAQFVRLGDIDSVGTLLGRVIGINMLTNGIDRVYIAGGILGSNNAPKRLRFEILRQLRHMNPYPARVFESNLSFLEDTHPALLGGIEYLLLMLKC